MAQYNDLIQKAYEAFNARDIDSALSLMHKDVKWPNGWEGGYVQGHDEVRDYWTRQWKEIDPTVEPVGIKELSGGQTEVEVHQMVKDLQGKVLFNSTVKHIYTIYNNLITSMEIKHV